MSQDQDYVVEAELVFAQDARPATPTQQDHALQALGATLLGEFNKAESDRRLTETRWLQDLRQYRGQYDPEVIAKIGPARSKAFVRKTRVKVKTTDSRVADLLFPAGAIKNWGIEPTPNPTLGDDQKREIEASLLQMAQGQPIPREVLDQALLQAAKESSKGMSRAIEDQLAEARYKAVCLKAMHSGHLYGTGIIKGPLVERKFRTRFVRESGKWVAKAESYTVPFVDFVPLWRFYPDMSSSELHQCRFVFERHTMSRHEMAGLAARKSFGRWKQKIVEYIVAHPTGESRPRYWDNELRTIGERHSTQGDPGGTYEVLERWGWLTGDQLANAGVQVPADRIHESFFSNVWLLPNGDIIKVALQPLDGVTWPYYLYYFDKDESSIFGEGLGAVMRDDQTMLNAATRMMLDNGAIAAGPQLEINPSLLSKVDNINEHGPWKVWLRNNTSPGTRAINQINFDSHLGELSAMAKTFEANADEVTAIPRYMSGENMSSGAAGTSSGLSMLMGAANIVIKDLITSWDEGITQPFIRAMYAWNMKFNPDGRIKGDFDVVATGTASLVAKEVRARQLNELAALTANEFDAPYVKRDVLNRKRGEANELSDVIKTEEEVQADMNSPQAQAQAQMQQQLMAAQLAELQARVAKMAAESDANLAKVELIRAQAVASKVSAAYAALQAGGVATSTPQIAPAGDEILRSAGWVDATPEPTIAQLAGPPVQPGAIGPQAPAQPGPDPTPTGPDVNPQTGMVGLREGIETARIEA